MRRGGVTGNEYIKKVAMAVIEAVIKAVLDYYSDVKGKR